MKTEKFVDVCLSPELLHLHQLQHKTAVIVDILRATSCITTGLAYGVKSVTPYEDLEECRQMKQKGYIIAGERNGKKVEGFDIGNSPFEYQQPTFINGKVAITTTNGTLAINRSGMADHIVIGSFLNLGAVAEYVHRNEKDCVIVCAGWKGKVNLEDTLFAGALIERLLGTYQPEGDSANLALSAFQFNKHRLLTVVKKSEHAIRLKEHGVIKDIEFCMSIDTYRVLPLLQGDEIVDAFSDKR